MFRLTSEWLRTSLQRRRIRRWFSATPDGGEALAAHAMWELNRHARAHGSTRELIYVLKRALIRELYHKYRPRVSLQRQTLTCWSCDGTGTWVGQYAADTCYKCHGTGIYRKTMLYQFTFSIRGRRYTWHQPGQLVEYPVKLDFKPLKEYDQPEPYSESGNIIWDKQKLSFRLNTVATWLDARGFSAGLTLRDAITGDADRLQRLLSYRIHKTFHLCPICHCPMWLETHEPCDLIPF